MPLHSASDKEVNDESIWALGEWMTADSPQAIAQLLFVGLMVSSTLKGRVERGDHSRCSLSSFYSSVPYRDEHCIRSHFDINLWLTKQANLGTGRRHANISDN